MVGRALSDPMLHLKGVDRLSEIGVKEVRSRAALNVHRYYHLDKLPPGLRRAIDGTCYFGTSMGQCRSDDVTCAIEGTSWDWKLIEPFSRVSFDDSVGFVERRVPIVWDNTVTFDSVKVLVGRTFS